MMNEVNTEKTHVLAAEAGKLGVKKEDNKPTNKPKQPAEGEVQVVQVDDSADKPVVLN